jgi:phosphatidylserine decarboxylase
VLARGTPVLISVPPALLLVTVATIAIGWTPLAWWTVTVAVGLAVLSVVGVGFFRDPERVPADGLLAPAHGRVLAVETEAGHTRVSTFMGPLDVHVVRAPLEGRVVSLERGGSGFARAYTPSASHNVSVELGLEGREVPFRVVMLSGWFARRIVPYVGEGDRVERGSRIGLVRFGSRVDVLVPEGAFEIRVAPGHRVRAGSSSLGVRTGASD